MIRLFGRVLSQPTIYYKNKRVVNGQPWNLETKVFQKPVELINWACVRIVQNRNYDKSIHDGLCQKNFEEFQSHLKLKGIKVKWTDLHGDLEIDGNGDYWKLDSWFKESVQTYGVTFLIVLLPERMTSELYNQIKRYGDVEHGIHTVCVKSNKLGDVRYDDNVALVSAGTFLF